MTLLEKGKDETKIEAMRRILITMLNGDPMPQLLMQIIRFVMPSRNKELKKLLHFYWEICPKHGPDGKLKQEMILVCNAIRNDLQHPNEYIRGATLRFMCKLREPELLEPLIPSLRACLDHRHAYVRKNAVFAVFVVASNSELIPDASELIHEFLENETDATCKRNAFVALSHLNRDEAFNYLQRKYTSIASLDELLQLAFIEFIRKDALRNPDLKNDYLQIIRALLEISSNTVAYEAASALTHLTNNAQAIQAAAAKYLELAEKESDNNIKLIVLEQVDELRLKNPGVLNDLTMDVLLVLSSPDLDVRKKALKIALSMISSKNVEEVVRLLKKELERTVGQDYEKNSEYRVSLIQAIHTCAIRFSEVAHNVVDLMLDFLSDANSNADSAKTTSANDVLAFVKEVVEIFPDLRSSIIKRLIESLRDVHRSSVYRGALWIIGEYCVEEAEIRDAWKHIRESLGELPIYNVEMRKRDEHMEEANGEQTAADAPAKKSAPKVLADGTYASESALTSHSVDTSAKSSLPPLRKLILDGEFFTAGVLAATLTKLVLRYSQVKNVSTAFKNRLRAEALLILTSIMRVGESDLVTKRIDEDSADRIYSCVQVLLQGNDAVDAAFLEDSHSAFRRLVDTQKKKRDERNAREVRKRATQADSPVAFRQFATIESVHTPADEEEQDLQKISAGSGTGDKILSRLNRIVQLTGFTDPVYAEAFVNVHQFDIVLEVLLFNQTTETLQNLSVEFATLGDLKVVERPSTQSIAPQSFHSVSTTIKVSSADAGVIFGNIVYEGNTAAVNNVVILDEIRVDIMDYIKPGHCSETEFRTMWSEFEWENKVNIAVKWPSEAGSLQSFLAFLLKNTNMANLTAGALPEQDDGDYSDECQFLSANLHARSSFGEDALANLSIEKDSAGKITGHVRIRSKGQGLALSLGDRIADLQRKQQFVAA